MAYVFEKYGSIGGGTGGGSYVLEITEQRGTLTDEQCNAIVANLPHVVIAYQGLSMPVTFYNNETVTGSLVQVMEGMLINAYFSLDFATKYYVFGYEQTQLGGGGSSGSCFTYAEAVVDAMTGNPYSGTLDVKSGSLETVMTNPTSLIITAKGMSLLFTYSHLSQDSDGTSAVYKCTIEGTVSMSFAIKVFMDGTYTSYLDSGLSSVYPTIKLKDKASFGLNAPTVSNGIMTFSSKSASHTDSLNKMPVNYIVTDGGYVFEYKEEGVPIYGDAILKLNIGSGSTWDTLTVTLNSETSETSINKITEMIGNSFDECFMVK